MGFKHWLRLQPCNNGTLGGRLASAILSQFVAYFLVLFLTHRFFFLRDFKNWFFSVFCAFDKSWDYTVY